MLRTALGNEHDGDFRVTQGAEETVGGAGHPDHAGALQIHQGNPVDSADALDRRHGRARSRNDAAAAVLRIERAANANRDLVGYRRRHGLGVNHARPEVRQFHGLVVGNLVDDRGFGNAPRVAAHDPVDVGPDVHCIRLEQGGKNRSGIVAAVAAQGRLQSVRISGDVTCNDGHSIEIGRKHRRQVAASLLPDDHGTHFTRLHREHVPRIDEQYAVGGIAANRQQRRQEPSRPQLPKARDHVLAAPGGGLDQGQRFENPMDVVEIGFELRPERRRSVLAQQFGSQLHVAPAHGFNGFLYRLLAGSLVDEVEQHVGDAARRGHHHTQVACRLIAHDPRHAPEAVRIGETAAAEFMDGPAHGLSSVRRCGRQRVRSSSDR